MKITNEQVILATEKLFKDMNKFLFDLDWNKDLSADDRTDMIDSVRNMFQEFGLTIVYPEDEDLD